MSAPRIESARGVIEAAELEIANVRFFKIAGEINEGLSQEQVDALVEEGGFEPDYSLKVRHEGRELGVRLQTHLNVGLAAFDVDAAINYTTSVELDITPAARIDFANEVGLMALLPYVRQAVADISQRILGTALVMPVMPRGSLSFSLDESEEDGL